MDPYVTARQIFRGLLIRGPCGSKRGTVHLFGGWRIFNMVCKRLGTLRRAVAAGRLDMTPVELFTEHEIEHEEGMQKLSDNH